MKSDFEKLCEYLAGTDDRIQHEEAIEALLQSDHPMRALLDQVNSVSHQWLRRGASSPVSPEHTGSAHVSSSERPQLVESNIQQQWIAFISRLIGVARGTIEQLPAESTARLRLIPVLEGFFTAVAAGRYPAYADHRSLWFVLIQLTQRAMMLKGSVSGQHGTTHAEADETVTDKMPQSPQNLPSSLEFCAMFLEQTFFCVSLTGSWLSDDELLLRRVVDLGLRNFSVSQMAEALHDDLEFLEMALDAIRARWFAESDALRTQRS